MTRSVVIALTVLTGFSGLVYEVSWERYLATLLGSHSEATAAVLGIFLGGLSIGYSLFGWLTRRWVAAGRGARLLLLYGIVEGSIGVYVLLFPQLFRGMLAVSGVLPQGAMGIAFALDVVLATLLIGPPAVLMGGTIPILTQALPRSAEDATRFHALIYAMNTAGAFVGALAAGFILIPQLGLPTVMLAMGLINLGAGLVFGLLGLRWNAEPLLDAEHGTGTVTGFSSYAGAALLAGFAMMSLQTILIRVGGLSLGASQFTFSMVVAVFVLCIALGSLGVSMASRFPKSALAVCQWLLVLMLFGLYRFLPYAPYGAHVLRTLFRDTDQAFHAYYVAVFLSILFVIGPVIVLSGAMLPLIFDHLRRHMADLGSVAGRLYSWNTFGSLLGALLGGYALLIWFELDQVFRVVLVAQAAAALLLGLRIGGPMRTLSTLAVVGALIGVVALDGWDPRAFVHGTYRTRQPTELSYAGWNAYLEPKRASAEIVFYDDDPISSVAVMQQTGDDGGIARSIVNNGKSDGNTSADYPTMGLLAVLPALLAEAPESGFVIGFGTGVTVGELVALPSVERVVVSEISPAVVEAAPLFDFANHAVSKSDEVEMIRADAYRALIGSDEEFDVIVSEPSNPWVQGIEMLFSEEFLTIARDRLSPGGVYAQWYHQYETDSESVELVLRTYAAVFDRVSVWYGLGPDLIILGFKDEARPLDFERLQRRAGDPAFAQALARAGVDSFTELLTHEILPLGVVHAADLRGPTHSLYEPILGYHASRAFFRGATGELPFTGFGDVAQVGRRNSLLRRRGNDAGAAELFEGMCGQREADCVALLARLEHARPNDPQNARRVVEANRRLGVYGGRLTINQIRSASRLVRLVGDTPSEVPVALSAARLATRQYVRFYSHAFPFSPQALLEIWERCVEPAGEPGACAAGLADARRILRTGSTGG